MLQWGLVPSWAKDPAIGRKLINARGETVGEKPSFRGAFRRRRCLVLADGYFEWKKEGRIKQPYYIRMQDEHPFAFAGIWDHWNSRDEQTIETCAILTTQPNELMADIHPRMPVILNPDDYRSWLDVSLEDPSELSRFLIPYAKGNLVAFPVSLKVNNPRFDGPACVESLER